MINIKYMTDEIILTKDAKVIVPSSKEIYYKKKFIKHNYDISTFRNLVYDLYDGSKKIINDNKKYLYMYKAFNLVSKDLKKYNNYFSFDFINELVKTYDDFYEFDLIENDRTSDLRVIYEKYESLILSDNLINDRLLINYVCKIKNGYKFIFLDVDDLSKDVLMFIEKQEDVTLYINNNDNKNIKKKLDIIGCNVDIKENSFNKTFKYGAFNDIIDEVKFISNDITKKLTEGYSYSDIIIVSNDINTYYPYLDLILNHNHNKKENKSVLAYKFIKLFSNIFSGDFSCKNFISLLKLELFDISMQDVNKLDNYVYVWDLEDISFYKEFTFNPNGNRKLNDKDKLDLQKLNSMREDIINPIYHLLQNILNENNKEEILKHIYTYLKEEKIIDNMFLKDEASAYLLVNLFDDMYEVLDSNISVSEVIGILNANINIKEKKLSKTNEILVSNLQDANYHDKKIVYLVGTSSDNIPSSYKIKSLLSFDDVNKEYLINKIEEHENKEKYNFYKALNNKDVIISYHKLSVDKALKDPSLMLDSLNLESVKESNLNSARLKEEYANLLSNKKIEKIDNQDFSRINDSNNHDLKINISNPLELYGKDLKTSPSSLEVYAKCPFSYFLNYGLKLNVKEKYLFDRREVGTFVHYILENIVHNDIDNITLDNMDKFISKYANNYLEDNNKIVNNRTKFVINYLSSNVKSIIKNIIQEQEISSFKPKYFELKINDEETIKPVVINLDKGSLKLSGIVDRMDVYENNDTYFYRIIDYKTGKKEFRLDNMLDGLNLQMLIYLLAIKENNKNITNKKIVPSGLLYYPALLKNKSEKRNITDLDKEKSVKERLKMNGIINRDLIDEMGKDDIGSFIAVTSYNKISYDKVFDDDIMTLIFDKLKSIIKNLGDDILSGKIDVDPIEGDSDSCEYCNFKSVCKFDTKNDKKRKEKKIPNKEVYKMLEGDNNA